MAFFHTFLKFFSVADYTRFNHFTQQVVTFTCTFTDSGKNGKAVIGTKVVTVAGKTYAVVKGYVKTGKGNRRITIANKTYVINKSGVVLTGKANRIVKVGKKKYIVNKKGVVLKKKKRIKIGRVIYSTDKKGVATKKK